MKILFRIKNMPTVRPHISMENQENQRNKLRKNGRMKRNCDKPKNNSYDTKNIDVILKIT